MNEGNKSGLKITGEIVKEYLTRFPKLGALTLAKKIYAENSSVYTDVEHVRSRIRYYLGQSGKEKRAKLGTRDFVRDARTPDYGIPESDAVPWAPVRIPERFNRGLIFSDNHFPYHDVQAHNAMLDHAVGNKKINFILINGDGMDCYQGSRFIRDPRKRSISDEIWQWIEFLNILQTTFPGVKIYWKLGNHEERIENYLYIKAPELLDMEEFQLKNIIKIRGVEGVDVIEHQIMYAGRLPIVHGHEFMAKGTSPVNPARGLFLKALSSSLTSHHHRTSAHSETDINEKLMSWWSIGCLCDLHPYYASVNKWNHGFAIMNVNDQEFEMNNMKIHKGTIYRD